MVDTFITEYMYVTLLIIIGLQAAAIYKSFILYTSLTQTSVLFFIISRYNNVIIIEPVSFLAAMINKCKQYSKGKPCLYICIHVFSTHTMRRPAKPF